MFGYVTPCKMELKIKDYEKFKAYYCGLCKSIKTNIGNIPRFSLNYDMTFLAILLDSIYGEKTSYSKITCSIHVLKKKIIVNENNCLKYAAFCNIILSYYKLLDNINDDSSFKSRVFSIFLKKYVQNVPPYLNGHLDYIKEELNNLNTIESLNKSCESIDKVSHPFAKLIGFILSSYKNDENKPNLYWLGYNLGKWIYIIDAWDDLENDIKGKKFNAINACFNKSNDDYKTFSKSIERQIDFTLVSCASECLATLNKLPLKRNEDLLYNILQLGLMEKMDKVFKRSVYNNEKSI
ncbi:hypothetical protein D4Z93_12310 [Clostridium fermenticellae]|uniref:Uncharacterized protein n=1 Tax=Clostridium fermenticellae TaxID=2068654 RepID=A0A386H6C2_9CLOT|nr:DUF5685 family protein [Clostridium fermenticellae]AYD41252.1 hypothetical protein D4Z93_12310 [Clostridium fermenticellae]